MIPTPGTEHTFSLSNLTLTDRQALNTHCQAAFGGYPDSPLEDNLDHLNLTPEDLYTSLTGTIDLRLMIAAAALRRVQRLPPDPRLNPAPHAKAPVRSPKTDDEAARRPTASTTPRLSGDDRIATVATNPKRPGSLAHDRYALYRPGLTRTEALKIGLTPADLRWDTERNFITWELVGAEEVSA